MVSGVRGLGGAGDGKGRATPRLIRGLGITALVTLAVAGPAVAQDPGSVRLAQADTSAFDIPAQPLSSALTAFGQQSGLQVTVDTAILSGLRSPGVSGNFAPNEALRLLLAGTGITWRIVDGRTVALEKVAAENSSAIVLDPVTVTGERVERSLMDTASSVAVFDSQAIEQRPRIDSTNDVLRHVPNVTATETSNFAPAVRGVDGTGPAQGGDAFFAGVRPRLNFQIDGRPASYNEVIFGDVSLWDVEQVEVFRGPQSTLQGRNAIAGAIVVTTKDPTYYNESTVRVIGGNQETRQISGMVSGPIVDNQLAFRLAVDHKSSESYVDMEPFPGVEDPRDFESTTLRGKLLIEPRTLDGFSTLVTLNHSDFTAPQGESVARPFDAHVSATPQMPVFNPRATSGIIDTTWELNDRLTFENMLSVTDLRIKREAPVGTGIARIDGLELVAEPRLRFSAMEGRLNGFGGVYLFSADQDEFIDFGGDNNYEDSTTTTAVFGEATLAVLDDLDVTAGGRLEREHRERVGGTAPFFDIDFDETYEVFLPKLGLAWHATDELTVGTVVSRGYNGGGAGFSLDPPFVSYTYEPEYVWNYEAYTRADLYDGRLSLTGNVFFSDYKDIQLPFRLGPLSTVIRNADEAMTYGAEVGATWLATRELELFANAGLLKTEITEYPDSGVVGNDLPRSPAFTTDIGAIYRHASGFELGVNARFSDAYYSDVDNNPRGKTDPYLVVNAQVGYAFSGGRVFAFVNNAFDSDEPIMLFPGAPPAEDIADLQRPRTFGVGLQLWF